MSYLVLVWTLVGQYALEEYALQNSGLLLSDNVNVHRAAANIIVSKSRAARGSVCSTPDMGVILWGASPLYIVSVSLLKGIIPKCKGQ